MRQPILLETGTHYFAFNTYGTTGAMITLAGTPALRASINGGDYVNAGLTLSVDHDYNGASAVTGAHRIALDIDNVTLALADGDELDVFLSAGTVDSMSKAGTKLWMVVALAAGLTTQEKADVNTEADTALTDYDGPTNTEMEARTLAPASYALEATLTTIAGYLDTEIAAILALL